MKLSDGEPCIITFKGKKYLIFREDMCKNSDYLFVECGIASEALINAYFDELYNNGE